MSPRVGPTLQIRTLEQWCAQIPGLARTSAGSWALPSAANVSFPAEAHTLLAAIEPRSYWFNHRNEVIAAAVRRHPPDGPIFDIGGGNGWVSLGLKQAGYECVVVEPSPIATANAAARGLPVICAPFQDLAIPDRSIPAAGMFDVLEHIEDDFSALAAVHRALAPGGRLYVTVPAHSFLWSQEDVEAGHFRRYALKELTRLLERAKFVVEYKTYFFGILIGPVLLARALPTRLGIKSAEKLERDHTMPAGAIWSALQWSFGRELARIAAGQTLKFGSSCLAVARKA
jgi:SAM-dependent methyltransferase